MYICSHHRSPGTTKRPRPYSNINKVNRNMLIFILYLWPHLKGGLQWPGHNHIICNGWSFNAYFVSINTNILSHTLIHIFSFLFEWSPHYIGDQVSPTFLHGVIASLKWFMSKPNCDSLVSKINHAGGIKIIIITLNKFSWCFYSITCIILKIWA